MSQENVEIVRGASIDAFNRRDGDALSTRCSPTMPKCVPCEQALAGTIYRGLDGGHAVSGADRRGSWRELQRRGRGVRDVGECSVLASGRIEGRGRGKRRRSIDARGTWLSRLRRRQGRRTVAQLSRPRRSPQSRGAGGVGDVAGERGDRARRSTQRRDERRLRAARCPDYRRGRRDRVAPTGIRAGIFNGRRRQSATGSETGSPPSSETLGSRSRRSRDAGDGVGAAGRDSIAPSAEQVAWRSTARGGLASARLRDGKIVRLTRLRRSRRGPQSRGAGGVGDVAGERGACCAGESKRGTGANSTCGSTWGRQTSSGCLPVPRR